VCVCVCDCVHLPVCAWGGACIRVVFVRVYRGGACISHLSRAAGDGSLGDDVLDNQTVPLDLGAFIAQL
jgi:hypothetical protein